ncbi:hypothetical protein IPC1020_18445 [Pseudomonas aeruginosa]|nr:hypothetical protein IPC1280_26140 [Pseudomonas aeruginosa]RPS04093.1 hypothetical protein IPC1020_18445 [Pseudomonas aeruginosa]
MRLSIQGIRCYPSVPIVPCLDVDKPLLGVEKSLPDTATCIGMTQGRVTISPGVLPFVATAMMPSWQDRRLAPYSVMVKNA